MALLTRFHLDVPRPSSVGKLRSVLSNPYVGRAAVAFATAESAQNIVSKLTTAAVEKIEHRVSVREDDALYDDVLAWLSTLPPTTSNRRLVAVTSRRARGPFSDGHDDGDSTRYDMKLMLDSEETIRVTLDGHRIKIYTRRPGGPDGPAVQPSGRAEPKMVTLSSLTYAGHEAVVTHLERIAEEKRRTRPVLRMVGSWGDWDRRNDLPPRPWESVILPSEQKNRIETDVQRFLDSESAYAKLGIPWHRGIMLHGTPGTGKTSTVRALADRFNLDLWYISLPDLTKESSLMSLLSSVSPRSLLLLEDIDTLDLSHHREDKDSDSSISITLGSLLNALDGVATPHGMITVMTTNHLDRLDPALIRTGRMDLIEELTPPGPDELRQLFHYFYGQAMDSALAQRLADHNVTQAEVAEIFKQHLDDPQGAVDALSVVASSYVRR